MRALLKDWMKAAGAALCVGLFASSALSAERVWTGNGGADNAWSNAANWSDNMVPGSGDIAVFNATSGNATVAVTDTRTVQQAHVRAIIDVTIVVESGMTFTVANSGANGLQVQTAGGRLTVDGPGTVAFSQANATNGLDNGAVLGATLTINAKISGGFCFEGYVNSTAYNGLYVLGNPANDFTGDCFLSSALTLAAVKLANANQPSAIGAGSLYSVGYSSTLRYTGAGDSTDRDFRFTTGNATIGYAPGLEQAGTGPLDWTGPVYSTLAAAATLRLLGDSPAPATISGDIYTTAGSLGIAKSGSGTWTLSGDNTFTDGITVNGGTLALASLTAAGTGPITVALGATLALNPSATPGFNVTLPAVASTGGAKIDIHGASTVTFSALSGAFAFTAPNAAIFVSGLAAGPVPGVTLNGNPAAYDLTLGLIEAPPTPAPGIATRDDTLPNGPLLAAVIDTPNAGGANPIALPAPLTELFSLTMDALGDAATVGFNGGTLALSTVAVNAGKDALTLGAAPQDGVLAPPAGLTGEAAIAALMPLIWYDPSDPVTVSIDAGNAVTGLANKGSGGAALDAGQPNPGFTMPLYATGADSHSALPMLHVNAVDQGLESLANTGITGASTRTLIAVMSRGEAASRLDVSFGNTVNRQWFALLAGYSTTATRFSVYGGDIDIAAYPTNTLVVMSLVNNVNGNPGTVRGFADGVPTATAPTYADLNTANSPLRLGYSAASGNAVNRGQIGEVLLFNRALTDTERATVEVYLVNKWKPRTVIPPAAVVPPESVVSSLSPLIWYDPSDAATVTRSLDKVTRLTNKGVGMDMDAVVRPGWAALDYATGAASHSHLPMLCKGFASQGMQSASNTGITGSANRTLIAVMSRTGYAALYTGHGGSTSGLSFSIALHNLYTRFETYSGDVDMAPVWDKVPSVLTFVSGVGGEATNFFGYVDGVASAPHSRASGFNTPDSPLCLGHRNGANGEAAYQGQIGEVILFDYTLSDQQRQDVEAYLIAKWKSARLDVAPQGGALTLRNDSAAPLTVNAAVNGAALIKEGGGTVTLAGGTVAAGALIETGIFALDTPAGLLDTFTAPVAGAGKLVKDGDGTLLLPHTFANAHAGGTDILAGTVSASSTGAFGTGPVVIADGAALDIGGNPVTTAFAFPNVFTVSGAGVDGTGVIVHNSLVPQQNAFASTVTLADDATFGGTGGRWDFRGPGCFLDLNGHILTKVGAADLRLFNGGGGFRNAPAGKAVHIQQGILGIESSNFTPNDSTPQLHIDGGARFGLYNIEAPFRWTIVPADNADIWSYGGNDTNRNVLTADMALPGTLHLSANGAFSTTLTGQISGPGGLFVHDGGITAQRLLAHPNNTYAGMTVVSNALLCLRYPDSLPNAANLRLTLPAGANTGVRIYADGNNSWPPARIKALAESGAFIATTRNGQRLEVEVASGVTDFFTGLSIGAPFRSEFRKIGAGTLVLDGATHIAPATGDFRVNSGTLILSNNAAVTTTHDISASHFYADTSTTILCDDAQIIGVERGYNTTGGAEFALVHDNGKAVVELRDNAIITNRLSIAGYNTGNTPPNSIAAIYLTDSSRFVSTSGGGIDGYVGRYGHGYIQIDDASELFLKGYTHLGTYGTGIGEIRQTGGRFIFNGLRNPVPAAGTITDSYGGGLGLSRAGTGVLHLEGGVFEHYGDMRILDGGVNATTASGTAVFTVTGTADAMTDRRIDMGNRLNATANVNLNGGRLTTRQFNRQQIAGTGLTRAYVNFNGGTLRVTNNVTTATFADPRLLVTPNAETAPLNAFVYDGGAVIDIGEGVAKSIDIPLERPEGLGVAAVNVNAPGTGYIAPPYVTFTGGGGANATAIARISKAGQLTGIEVTNPGYGYTSAPTVTLTGGGGSGATISGVAMAMSAEGGLTKTGPGALTLNAPCTYLGPTRVEQGALVLGCPDAIHPESAIIISDGTLNLGGHTITNISVTLTGSGAIINGKLVTASAVKTGPGTATWDVELAFAPIQTQPFAGLFEGFVTGYPNTTTPNPCTAIELTTVAANGNAGAVNTPINGKPWTSNCTYIYSGYIWNRAGTNETWTFAKSFDDRVDLTIDGITVMAHPTYNAVARQQVTLSPGPHAIEIRFGQGTGGVGAMAQPAGAHEWWNNNTMPMGIDFLGRNEPEIAYYAPIEDPGDGSFLTLTASGDTVAPDTALRVLEGTLAVPAKSRRPGLWEGRLFHTGNIDVATPNPCEAVELTHVAANGNPGNSGPVNGKPWANNNTYVYTGFLWSHADTNETWTFAKSFDDEVQLLINGQEFRHGTWNAVGRYQMTIAPGANTFEVRFGQGAGGMGAIAQTTAGNEWWTSANMPLGADKLGRNTTDIRNYELLVDPGDGSVFTLDNAPPNASVLDGVNVDVADGATLDLGGVPRDGMIISPGGDDLTATISVDDIAALNGMTYRLTIHDPPAAAADLTAGLWEGHIQCVQAAGYWDLLVPNPKGSVQLTTRAGNVPYGTQNSGERAEFWGTSYNIWIYTGYLWNRSGADQTWTFRARWDDYVSLTIDGNLILNCGATATYADYTLTPGPHAIEIRFADGTGSVGANDNPNIGGLTYDPSGGGSAAPLSNFRRLEDTGTGAFLTTTAEPTPGDNGPSDVITRAGALDLTGLTITPSDLPSATPPGSKYVIATAEGGFTGTPTLDGFDPKWRTLRKGNELWLTTLGGTIILLR